MDQATTELYHIAACVGKFGFSSYSQATKVIKQRQRAGSKGVRRIRAALTPYKCQDCGAWHVGTNRARK
jgi:hypothetical protein